MIANLTSPQLLQQMAEWVVEGSLRSLDLALAKFIQQQVPDSPPEVLLACALVSESNGHGHTCFDLQQALLQPNNLLSSTTQSASSNSRQQLVKLLKQLDLQHWLEQLQASPAISNQLESAQPNNHSPLVLAGQPERPLLYLRRYWHYEQQIHQAIQQRLQQPKQLPLAATKRLVQALFTTAAPNGANDWQKIACLLAARSNFAIITGGPGTGKTTTVIKLLALLQGLRQADNLPPLSISLAAPTGKAAARLSESISGSIARLELPAELEPVRANIPHQVTTLHRLLGSRPQSRHFVHNAANPIPSDLVVIDEASMMDIEMMSCLLAALPATAGLILLGDKDQLASVEAGSVLGDLCQNAEAAGYNQETSNWLAQIADEQLADNYLSNTGSALQQATAMLRHSYRFSAHPGIGELATLVNSGKANLKQLQQCFISHPQSLQQITLGYNQKLANLDLEPLKQLAVQGYAAYLRCLNQQAPQNNTELEQLNLWAKQVFAAHNSFQLLTAVRQGDFGVEGLNQSITAALQRAGLLAKDIGSWYHGRPLLVTRNDYSLELMNGDIGICMQWPDGELRVAFPVGDNIRWILPSRLQEVETVFAMTVHKSQGSEFTHTALVLPEHSSPVLTKELIYTGITRSKAVFTLIHSRDSTLQQALASKVERASGLS